MQIFVYIDNVELLKGFEIDHSGLCSTWRGMTSRYRNWLVKRQRTIKLSGSNKAFITKLEKDELKERWRWQESAELCNGKRDTFIWHNSLWTIPSAYVTAVHGHVMSSDFLKIFGQNVNDRGLKPLTWFNSTYSNYENGKSEFPTINWSCLKAHFYS